jgi:uncharacterized protein YcfJ
MKTRLRDKRSLIFVALMLLLCLPQCVRAEGRKIVLTMQNKNTIVGELLSVRDHEIVIAKREGYSDDVLSKESWLLRRVPRGEIREVKVYGESHVTTGIGIGSIVGLVAGIAIASGTKVEIGDYGKGIGIVAGSVAGGALVGGLVGLAFSRSDVDAVTVDKRDFTSLKRFARFPEGEPAFLQKFGHD